MSKIVQIERRIEPCLFLGLSLGSSTGAAVLPRRFTVSLTVAVELLALWGFRERRTSRSNFVECFVEMIPSIAGAAIRNAFVAVLMKPQKEIDASELLDIGRCCPRR